MQTNTISASGIIDPEELKRQQEAADEAALELIPPIEQMAIDEIWDYDGTAGFDPCPDFVKADNARWMRGKA